MIIKREQIKAAKRHAFRLGYQIRQTDDTATRRALCDAWAVFIQQFGDPFKEPGNQVIHYALLDAYHEGVDAKPHEVAELEQAWRPSSPVYITT